MDPNRQAACDYDLESQELRRKLDAMYERAEDRFKTLSVTDFEGAACWMEEERANEIKQALDKKDYTMAGFLLEKTLYEFFVWDEAGEGNQLSLPIQTPGPI